MKRLFKLQSLMTIGLFAMVLVLAGCEGDRGRRGPPGPPGPGVSVPDEPGALPNPALTASESCDVCHGPGAFLLPMNQFHDAPVIDPVNEFVAEITNVAFTAGPGTEVHPVVTFTATLNGAPLTFDQLAPVTNQTTGARSLRAAFGIAKLIPGVNGDADAWQSYINRVAAGATTIGGQPFTPALTAAFQATTEAVVGNLAGDGGTFTYTFDKDLANAIIPWTEAIPAPPGAPTVIPYEPTFTHRVGIQFTPSIVPEQDVRFNTVLDAVPDGSEVTVTRNIATTESCLECHTRSVIPPRWGFHGSGARVEVEYCVLCHNPGTPDPESGELVHLAVMVHKIHRGRDLPSVQAGGSYIIWGNNNSVHDYSHVGYPQDIRNCEKCHTAADPATPDGDNWMTRPTMLACGSCHDDVVFFTPVPEGKRLHSGGALPNNAACTLCHPASGPGAGQSVAGAHAIPGRAESATFQFNVLEVTNTAPGQTPSVRFSVTDPTNADAPYNILTDAPFLVGGGASRLAVIIGWKTGNVGLGNPSIDWTNEGSGNNVGQPVSINPLAPGVASANPDGSFTVTSPVAIPGNAEGTGVAALEGHPALADGTRIPVRNAFLYFGITDPVPEARREVVTVAGQTLKCDNCHDVLSVHGNNRTDSIEVCVICHNPNATDIGRRPADGSVGIDGKLEETIDFKNLIHAIHASGEGGGDPRTIPVVIYGFGGTPNDFSEVTFPGNMRKCSHCHEGTTWQLPLQTGILATTVNSAEDKADPDDDGNITKTAGVCSACHDAASIRAHMQAQGAEFNVLQGNIIE